ALMNPSGVVFGNEAQLDVRGSFHAGTGDSVAFADGERFSATPAEQGVLTTAPPAAFGFLPGSEGAPLTVDRSHLEVDPGETLELVAGDLTVTGTASDTDRGAPQLATRGGHIRLEAQHTVELSQAHV